MVNREHELLKQTRRLYEATYRFDAHAAAALGLHITDLRCINALEHGPLSAGEIGRRLALTSGSVTALVGRLAKAGYVQQTRDLQDKRRSLIDLTPSFRAESERVFGRLGSAITRAFADVSDRQLDMVTGVLARLTEGFSSSAQECDDPEARSAVDRQSNCETC